MNAIPKTLITVSILVAAILAGTLWETDRTPVPGSSSASFGVPGRNNALLDEVVFTRENAKGQMTELVASGSHQIAAQGISDVTTFRRLRSSEKLAYDMSYGSTSELTFNVAGPTFIDGTVNPFSVPKIREAVNWLINRDHIAEEIYGGLAVPRYLTLYTAFPDSARLAETVRKLEVKYQYDPEHAKAVIERELSALGAERVDDKWHHNGEPLQLRILIRIEDERQLIGDYVADLFHDMGFTVERMYRSASEASRLWMSGDPFAGAWHIYTGGWVSPFISRDMAATFNYYYTPRGRPNGLWQAYRPTPEFDEITDRLARRDYKTWEERQRMMRRALELSMEDSSRIWLVDEISAWARSPDVSLAVDLAGGTTSSSLWPFTLRYEGRSGGSVKIALPALLADPFNPIAGSNWTFDLMVMRGLRDSPVIPDPFTGLYLPQQVDSAEVTVRRNLVVNATHDWIKLVKVDDIEVPPDTWIDWNVKEGRWITVGEKYPDGVTTETRTRIQYPEGFLDGHWHDGSKRSLADILLPWILTFERSDPESPLYDPALVPAFSLFEKTFRGRRIVSTDPLIIESYGGPVFPDAESIAATRSPGLRGTSGILDINVPWHTLALAIRAESQGDVALSSSKADRERVEWTNLIDGPSLEILHRHLQQAQATEYLPFPGALGDHVDAAALKSRYDALASWYQQRGHFWVGDGPYYLHAVHAIEGSVVLRPSAYYDQPVDKWLRYAEPRIPAFDIDGPMITRLGQGATFDIDIRFDGKPYPLDDIERVGYMLFNSGGEMASSGSAKLEGGRWQVKLDEKEITTLGVGGNRLEVAVSAKPVALPTFGSHGFATVPADVEGHRVATTDPHPQ
jgi:peptide/nickel transport system substrate-binding protein